MNDSYDKDFDLGMRSLLENATEEVPSGAWDAVCGTLRRRRRAAAVRRWSAIGLSAAAATALVLSLSGVFSPAGVTPSEEQIVAEVTEDSEAPAVQEVSEVPASDLVAQASEPAATRRVRSASTKSAPVRDSAPGDASPAVSSATTKAQPRSESAGEAVSEAKESGSEAAPKSAGNKPQVYDDPFARMDYEESLRSRSRKAVSVDLMGLVGTNDKAASGTRGNAMMGVATTGASSQSKQIVEDGESSYSVPVSFGLGVRYHFTDRWSVGAGVTYSSLSRRFDGKVYEGSAAVATPVTHNVQYIGIPVNVYFDVLANKAVNMYLFAGGSVEKGIGQTYSYNLSTAQTLKSSVPGLQGSAALGMGVKFRLYDRVGLYVDPGVRYYFGANQPKSIRTQQPLSFNIEAGLRFDL